MIVKPIGTSINTSTYTAIKLSVTDNIRQKSISFFEVDDTGNQNYWWLADNSSGTDAVVVPAGLGLSYSVADVDADGTVFYAKASTGTPKIVCLVGGNK